MKESVFLRAFSYRQRENHSPSENYLTEIFAYCLEYDKLFLLDFMKLFMGIEKLPENIRISTQQSYEGYDRPDIEIEFDSTSILIECKVEAAERENQLLDYSSILVKEKKAANKHVILITKYFQQKPYNWDGVSFKLLRWLDVFQFINNNHSEITRQLKLYLKNQEMENVKNSTIQDIIAMKTIPETISKMEEVLVQLRPEFERHFGSFFRQKTLDHTYNGWGNIKSQGKQFELVVGFDWLWEEYELPFFGIWINAPRKKFQNTELVKIFNKVLVQQNGWMMEDETNPYILRPVTDFIDKGEDCIPMMIEFANQHLQTIIEVKKKYPRLIQK